MTNTTTKNEHLSAMLDDEAGAFEQKRMLDELQKDEVLQQKVASWSLIGETLRSEQTTTPVAESSFLAGIHEQLELEDDYHQVMVEKSPEKSGRSWYKPVLGGALAAGLAAAMVVVSLQQPQDQPQVVAASDTIAADNVPVTIAEPTVVAKVNNVERSIYISDKDLRKRLKRYVNNHVKYGSKTAIMPGVRAIGYAANY